MRLCTVEGCDAKHYGKGWCRRHYIRMWERGTLETRAPVPSRVNNSGYRLVHRPGHPLATSPGDKGLEHRIVLYDAIGPGTHPCHRCQRPVTWGVDLTVDHLDADKLNNNRDNLAPCCAPCNVADRNVRYFASDEAGVA